MKLLIYTCLIWYILKYIIKFLNKHSIYMCYGCVLYLYIFVIYNQKEFTDYGEIDESL